MRFWKKKEPIKIISICRQCGAKTESEEYMYICDKCVLYHHLLELREQKKYIKKRDRLLKEMKEELVK